MPCAPGAQLAFGKPVEIVPRLDAADVILAIDSDLLTSAPGHVRHARDFADTAQSDAHRPMSRIYAVGPTPTLIGGRGGPSFVAGPRDMHRAVMALPRYRAARRSRAVGCAGLAGAGSSRSEGASRPRFCACRAASAAELHALVHAMNEALGGRGTTYELIEPVEASPVDQAASLRDLLADMQAGHVQSLVIIDSNPVLRRSRLSGSPTLCARVPFSLVTADGPNETSRTTHWSLPQRHPYEDWSDARAYDGTATILQPQALPLMTGSVRIDLLGCCWTRRAGRARCGAANVAGDGRGADWHDALCARRGGRHRRVSAAAPTMPAAAGCRARNAPAAAGRRR